MNDLTHANTAQAQLDDMYTQLDADIQAQIDFVEVHLGLNLDPDSIAKTLRETTIGQTAQQLNSVMCYAVNGWITHQAAEDLIKLIRDIAAEDGVLEDLAFVIEGCNRVLLDVKQQEVEIACKTAETPTQVTTQHQ